MLAHLGIGFHLHTDLSPLHHHLSVRSDSRSLFFLPSHLEFLFYFSGSLCFLSQAPSSLHSVPFFLFGLSFVVFNPSLHLHIASPISPSQRCALLTVDFTFCLGLTLQALRVETPRQGWVFGPLGEELPGLGGGAKNRHSAVSPLQPHSQGGGGLLSSYELATCSSPSLALAQARFL